MKPNSLRAILQLTGYALLSSLRNRGSLFFSLVFPLIFIAIFGLLGASKNQLTIGALDSLDSGQPLYAIINTVASSKDSPITLQKGTQVTLEKKLSQGKIDALIEPGPDGRHLQLLTSNSNAQGGAQASGVMSGLLNRANLQAAGVSNPAFGLDSREISGKPYRSIDFALPGQLGFSLVSIATFGVAFPFLTLRKTLVLKRIFATGVSPLTFIVSQGLSRSLQALFQTAVLIIAGVLFFHFSLANGVSTVLQMLILAFLGVITFLGFGILFSNIARDEQTLPIVLNLFSFPQFLLAGVFFPTDNFPDWLQKIGNNLPLAYLNQAMRKVATDGVPLTQTWPFLLGLLAWALFAYVLAARTFKDE